MMVVEIDDGGNVNVRQVNIAGEQAVFLPKSTADMAAVVKKVVKEMDWGKSVKDIAAKCRIEEELAEQICRMYATHPGIDVDGILNRITKLYN